MNFNRFWTTVLSVGLFAILQLVILYFASTPLYTVFTLLFLEAFIVLVVLWTESRSKSRHEQVLKRVARASTRPEINDMKWQLEQRDSNHLDLVIAEIHTLDRKLSEQITNSRRAITDEIRAIETGERTLEEIFKQLSSVKDRVQATLQLLHQLETTPKYAQAIGNIEHIRHEHSKLWAILKSLKNLTNEAVVRRDLENF